MKKERIKKMKKKVMCMLLTGMMAASMIAGCGNSGNASVQNSVTFRRNMLSMVYFEL